MVVNGYKKTSNGLEINTSHGLLNIIVYSSNILRVVYTREKVFSDKESLMVKATPSEKCTWNVCESDSSIDISTDRIRINIRRDTGAFTYFDEEDKLLVKEPDRGGKTLQEIDVFQTVTTDKGNVVTTHTIDGDRVKSENTEEVFDRKAYHTKLEFEWDNSEALYGLGSHDEGILNLRGTHQYLYQQNTKAVVPYLISSKGYGILLDSCSLITFHDDIHGSYLWTDVDDEMDFYFIYGPELDDLVHGFRSLTGQAPMFPKWVFGYMQSKERYRSQAEMLAVVQGYRDRQIPLDTIILDWQYWLENLWGQKSLDPERFPDPAALTTELHKLGVKLMVSIWPNMTSDGANQVEMREHGYLLGNDSTYNAFSEPARKLYWKQVNEGLFSFGVDAWWCDCTEPFEADWSGPVKPEPENRLHLNVGEAKRYLDPQYINAYSLLHSKGIYEGQRDTSVSKRVVNLTRSAYAGQQRYGTITWSGDIAATWQTLKAQIVAGLNFCAAGMPYWTMDIGAFFVASKPEFWFWNGDFDGGCDDFGYREIYLRWFQLGAFLPIFRSHGTDTPREVWQFGEPGTMFYDSIVKFIHLRYRLLPYIYSLAGWTTHRNYTMMRLLAFDFRFDEAVLSVDDQFMFGPAFLVNPITEPMYYHPKSEPIIDSKKSRGVYLPKGTDWYDFWTGKLYKGGQTVQAEATLDVMPLFVRAGSILPLAPVRQYAEENCTDMVEIRIYPGMSGRFTIYEDAGDGYEYESGALSLIEVKWHDKDRVVEFLERQGEYDGMCSEREFHVVLVSEGTGIGIEPELTAGIDLKYNGNYLSLRM